MIISGARDWHQMKNIRLKPNKSERRGWVCGWCSTPLPPPCEWKGPHFFENINLWNINVNFFYLHINVTKVYTIPQITLESEKVHILEGSAPPPPKKKMPTDIPLVFERLSYKWQRRKQQIIHIKSWKKCMFAHLQIEQLIRNCGSNLIVLLVKLFANSRLKRFVFPKPLTNVKVQIRWMLFIELIWWGKEE